MSLPLCPNPYSGSISFRVDIAFSIVTALSPDVTTTPRGRPPAALDVDSTNTALL